MKAIRALEVTLAAVLAGCLAFAGPAAASLQEDKKQEEKKQEEKQEEKQDAKKEEKKVSKNPLDWAKRPFMEERKREVDIRGEFKKMKDGSRYVFTTMSGIQVSVTIKEGRVTHWESLYRGRQLPIGFEKTAEDTCWVITPDNMRNEDLWLRVPCETIEGRIAAKPPA
jgi:uncharacterized protein YdeI (BOF family)